MEDQEKKDLRNNFYDLVNMAPAELESWLETEDSQSVGQKAEDGEAIGHKSGKKIVSIKRSKNEDLQENDYDHMKKVVSYIKRHLAQKPANDLENSRWRYSLMNWGHDPCKHLNC
jgi:hypothetical protein